MKKLLLLGTAFVLSIGAYAVDWARTELASVPSVPEDSTTQELPVDMSDLIVNGTFDVVGVFTGWQGTQFMAGGTTSTCAEHYAKMFDTYQDITGLPNGIYAVSVKGFYRYGTTADDWTTKDDPSCRHAKLYAVSGATYSVPLQSLSSIATEDSSLGGTITGGDSIELYVPGTMADFTAFKEAGKIPFVTVTVPVVDGHLRIGVVKDVVLNADWVIVDDFTLEYLGTNDELIAEALVATLDQAHAYIEERNSEMTTPTLAALEEAIAQAESATDSVSSTAAITMLNAAMDAAKVNVSTYVACVTAIDEMDFVASEYETSASELAIAKFAEVSAKAEGAVDMTTEELIVLIDEIKYVTTALKLPVTSGASDETPVDMTIAIANADFSLGANNGDWHGFTSGVINGPAWSGGNRLNNGFEFWSDNSSSMQFDIHQVIPALPAGKYMLTADLANSTNGFIQGTNGGRAHLYATVTADTTSTMTSTPVEPQETNCDEEMSTVTVLFNMPSDATVQVGVKTIGVQDARWFAGDNFSLYYYGEGEWEEGAAPTIPTDTIFKGDYEALSNALNAKIDSAWSYYYEYEYYNYGEVRMNYYASNVFSDAIYRAENLRYSTDYNSMFSAYENLVDAQVAAELNVKAYSDVETAYDVMYQTYNENSDIAYQDAVTAYNNARNKYNNAYDMETKNLVALLPELKTATDMLTRVIEYPGYAAVKDTVTVHVDEPGTLGEKVLMQTEYLTDLFYLVVTGKLNDADIDVIQNGMTYLQGIDMSGLDMTAIPDNMFQNKWHMKELILPKNIETIGNRSFALCNKLREVVIPESVTSIGDYAFEQCTFLEYITLPSKLQTLGYSAFTHCYSLKEVIIPEGVTSMGGYCFYECRRLTKAVLPSTLAVLPSHAFYSCDRLATVEFAEGLATIGTYAFYECWKLDSVELPTTLNRIENFAFYNCTSLTEVTIPAGVTYCSEPFYDCDNLQKVTCLAFVPPYNNYGNLTYNDENITLYVPALSLTNYKLDTSWNQFKEILPIDAMPEVINVYNDYRFLMPDSLPADYKPVVNLVRNPNNDKWYGTLTVVGNGETTFSMKSFMMDYDPNRVVESYWNYGYENTTYNSLVSRSDMRSDSIFVNLYMKNNYWAFLSFPYDVKVSDITPVGETSWVIREYAGQARAAGNMDSTWVNVPEDGILEAGKGYIWQAVRPESNYNHFIVPALDNANKNKIFAKDDCTVALAEYQSEFSHNRSWNLIGNPYPCYYDSRFMDFSAPITVWNDYNRTYEAYSLVDDSRILRPGEAIFVQRPVDSEAVIFSTEGRQINHVVREIEAAEAKSISAHAGREVFNLFLGNGENTDKTRFVINSLADAAYDASTDASKFMSSDKAVSQIYTIENGVEMAINERPFGNGVVALGAYFGATGSYTITLDTKADRQITLVDKLTGVSTDLSQGGYEFTADMGVAADRFEIIVGSVNGDGGTTGINGAEDNAVEVKAADGQIVVTSANVVDIIVYTVDGKTVSAIKAANAAIDVEPGVYVIKVAGKNYKVSVK